MSGAATGAPPATTFHDPAELFPGGVLIVAPHIDDEVLGVGGTIARLPHKERVHVAYATDGSRSPAPPARWLGPPPAGLAAVRAGEAREALDALNVAEGNLHFLQFPDGRLEEHEAALSEALLALAQEIRPAALLVPFRYDRHPDHLAVNRVARSTFGGTAGDPELLEYFVYYRSRLLPRGDVRAYVRPGHLVAVDIRETAAAKRRALECFRSQTTRMFDFQRRPNLTPELLDQVCRGPELFLRYSPHATGPAIFEGPSAWIRAAHRIEPVLKRRKDQLVALWRSAARS